MPVSLLLVGMGACTSQGVNSNGGTANPLVRAIEDATMDVRAAEFCHDVLAGNGTLIAAYDSDGAAVRGLDGVDGVVSDFGIGMPSGD